MRAIGRTRFLLPSSIGRLGLLVALVLTTPFLAWATRMVPLAIEQLAGSAELIVQARVRAVSSQRDADGRIFTRVNLDPVEVWKGRLTGGVCSVVTGGGILGDQQVAAAGQAEYAVGDEVVLFLVPGSGGDWVTVGLEQGRFRVERDPASRQKVVSNPFWGNGTPSRQAPTTAEAASPVLRVLGDRRSGLTLDELKRRVTESVDASR